MILEFYKKTLEETYRGNLIKMYNDGYFIEWTREKIKNTFNYGNGTDEDFKKYMKNNRPICIFINN